MADALVVDDSADERERAGRILEAAGLRVAYAKDGREALAALERRLPDIVVTGVAMPELDGLQLIDAVQQRNLPVPVVILTDAGSEDTAAAALGKGAASYVPKARLESDLADTVQRVVQVARERPEEGRAFQYLDETEYRFVLNCEPMHFRSLIAFLRRQMARRGLGDEAELTQVAVALDEALANALHHGNLEVSSELRDRDLSAYFAEIERRRKTPPWCHRKTVVTARMGPDAASFVIRDEGQGFDPSKVPDPTAPENVNRSSGRGLYLLRMIMDEVHYNEAGNEVTLVKRRTGHGQAAGDRD